MTNKTKEKIVEMYKSARELVESIEENLALVKEQVILDCCENIQDARQISSLCAALVNMTGESFVAMEQKGFGSEDNALKNFVLLQVVVVGGATIQKWLAEKAAEYEELKDAS